MLGHVVSVLVFLMAVTVVAELADSAGVFEAAAVRVARLGHGRVWVLWLGSVALATASTVFLSLDTTAVLLTPVVLTLAHRLQIAALPFAMTTVWLANTASLLLPVSNLTNLLSLHSFGQLGLDSHAYVRLMWRPAAAAVLVTIAVLAIMFGRNLRGRYPPPKPEPAPDRVLFGLCVAVCLILAPLFASGLPVVYPAAGGAVVLIVGYAVRAPDRLSLRLVPWRIVGFAAGLFVVIDLAGHLGLTRLLTGLLPAGSGPAAIVGLAAIAAITANVVDNLPAYFALAPVAADHPTRLAALLIGTNVAPLLTSWASMANLLWRHRAARAGLTISAMSFAWRGAVLAPVATAAALAALLSR